MNRQKKIAAIHDISCTGRCSLTVALPVLSAAGIDTAVLPTAVLSTHTGNFENYTYKDLTDDLLPIANHWKSLDIKFDALFSGFLGSYHQIDIVMNIFKMFKNENTLIMVDPVMADNGILYTTYTPEIAQGMAKLCTMADIIVPNITEAAFLVNEEYISHGYSKDYIENLLFKLSKLGAKKIVITGVSFDDNEIGAACYDTESKIISYAMSEKFDDMFYGSGDAFASALLGALLNDNPLDESIRIAVDFTNESIVQTVKANQERRYGVCFERALPKYIKDLGL